MTLYEDHVLVDLEFGDVTSSGGKLSQKVTAKVWTISHSWPLWAIKINDNLILN